ncbi:MAG: phytanoyl-CoA dioxygenase family protein [Pseudomonadota bacterium]
MVRDDLQEAGLDPLTPHSRNKDFVWQQPRGPLQIISEAQARDYREIGGFVLTDAFSSDELRPLIAELDALEAEANTALQSLPEGQPSIARHDKIVFSAHAVLRSPAARAFAAHSVFQQLCHDLIGGAVRLYWDQLVYKRPGTAEEFPWHQDNGYTYVDPQQYLTCWVALTDATEANGCPWIAPGRHQLGTLKHRWTDLGFSCMDAVEDAQAMPLRAGSVAVFSSLTPHRTGPNLSTDLRRAYILQYAPDGARVFPRMGPEHVANDADRQFLITP